MNEKKTYIPLLPKTKGKNLKKPDERGKYEENLNLLEHIPADLVVAKGSPTDVLTAIPTIWARPMLFGHALIDEHHTAHESVEQEWRGLLGIFCFKDFLNLSIKPVPYRLSSDSKGLFEGILYSLRPDPSDPLWNTIHLIYVENILVGGTSPLSLFFTAADYKLPASFFWQKNGLLIDPVHHFKELGFEGDKYLRLLRGWIEKAKQGIRITNAIKDKKVQSAIVSQLDEWADDTEADIGQITKLAAEINVIPYSLITEPIRKPEGIEFDFQGDFFLQSRRKTNVIVAWKEGWEQREKKVYGAFTAGGVEFPKDPKGNLLANGRINCEWIRPEKLFFTDKMLRLSLDSRNVLLHHDKGYVPPLEKEILQYFTPEELSEIFEWGDIEGEAILKIPLTNGDTAVISRIYDKKDIVDETYEAPAPFLALWPDFKAEDWKHYYCVSQKPTTQLRFEPCGLGTSDTAEKTDLVFWKFVKFPEAMNCLWQGKSAGLILIKEPKEIGTGEGSWKVSVDFGTSNTSIFYQGTLDDDTQPLIFKNRCVLITKRPDEIAQRIFLISSFFPWLDAHGMFSTVFGAFPGTRSSKPIFDGVTYLADFTHWTACLESWKPRGISVVPNLKWTTDPTRRDFIFTFLQQLFLMIAAEARFSKVKVIELHWSYPSAFSKKMYNDLNAAWNTLGQQYALDFPFEAIKMVKSQTESVAVCRYLVEERKASPAAKHTAQITVDVGGGTSDIAVWLENQIQAQSSILLAGNALSDFVATNSELCQTLATIGGQNVTELLKNKSTTASTLNMVLKFREKEIILRLLSEREAPHIKRARTIVFLMFAGVVYYAGLLLKKIAEEKDIEGCDMYFAGNGAKLIKWVENPPQACLESLKTFMANITSLKERNINIETPKHPKEEVARGLLQGAVEVERTPVLLLGESGYKLNNQDLSWSEDLESRKEIIDPDNLEPPKEFKELNNLVDIFDREAEDLSLETIKQLVDGNFIRARMDEKVSSLYRDPEKALIQPFFVEEVRLLLWKLSQV